MLIGLSYRSMMQGLCAIIAVGTFVVQLLTSRSTWVHQFSVEWGQYATGVLVGLYLSQRLDGQR